MPTRKQRTNAVVEEIRAERDRQVNVEGWTEQHDAQWGSRGDLVRAAACYTLSACAHHDGLEVTSLGTRGLKVVFKDAITVLWPWLATWWKPTTPRRDLVKAAALIIAEIERRDRAEDTAPELNRTYEP